MVHAEAAPLREEEIQGLLATIRAGDFERGQGKRTVRSPREDYFTAITERVMLARKLRVVVDAGNGVAGTFAPELLRRLGCEVTELYCESDGTFPKPSARSRDGRERTRPRGQGCGDPGDVGIAYDGDADRMGVIDDRGRRHERRPDSSPSSRAIFSPVTRAAEVVFDVKSSQALADDIRAHGGKPTMWKTGHSHLKQKMRDDHILLGGEVSGHMFFGENWYGVDDGILASCKFLELASQTGGSISASSTPFPISSRRRSSRPPAPTTRSSPWSTELARSSSDATRPSTSTGCASSFPRAGASCGPRTPTRT